ncbi:MAG: malic enzyme-like NAD(P)-binding protein [Gammaproteobacteria bacterium]
MAASSAASARIRVAHRGIMDQNPRPRVMQIPEILLVESEHRPGSLGRILTAIGECGVVIDHLTAVSRNQDKTVWEITIEIDPGIGPMLYERLGRLPNARLIGKSDRVFDRHRGGKIEMVAKVPLDSLQQLRDLYTPGVARVCLAIQNNPEALWDYTNYGNSVGIVTNGTAILGLGAIGAQAGLPVMEGKSMIYSKMVGISGIPILINETDPGRIIDHVTAIADSFAAIHLEDISAPACFEITEALETRLAKPVLHDDQQGTAVVALAALLSATREVHQNLHEAVIGQIGLGAAGIGISRLLLRYGIRELWGADLRPEAIAQLAALGGRPARIPELMQVADIVITTTGVKNLISKDQIRPGQIIFALSNPEPEISAREALEAGARFATDGRSVNNALGFPGLIRGALNSRAPRFTDAMFLAAAHRLADLSPPHEILPDVLNPQVHATVAEAVAKAAESGAASTPR